MSTGPVLKKQNLTKSYSFLDVTIIPNMQSRRILKSILSSVWSEHFVREKKLEQMDDLPAEKRIQLPPS